MQRRQLVSALTRRPRALAAERGHPVSTAVATQVEETLRAAMSDPDAGEALLSGRLTSPMSYSGLGTTVSRPDLRLVHPPRTERPAPAPAKAPPARKEPAGDSAAERRRREQEERKRAAEEKRQRELAEARAAAEEASAAADEAEEVAAERRGQVEELTARREELQARVDELADQLSEAERAAAEAATSLKREERRRAAAEREAADAAEVRDRARARVDHLTGGDAAGGRVPSPCPGPGAGRDCAHRRGGGSHDRTAHRRNARRPVAQRRRHRRGHRGRRTGSSVEEVHDRGTENTTGEAPVEQRYGDPEMTEGQVVPGDGEQGRHRALDDPAEGTSGGAQSDPAARVTDRLAAGEEPPADPSA